MRHPEPLILVVEDNAVDAMMLQRANQESSTPCSLVLVENGDSALGLLRQVSGYESAKRPDLVLLDLNLPGMHGLEVLRSIKNDPTIASIPVVVLSTSELDDDIAEAYRCQAAAYIQKPVGTDRFAETLAAVQQFWLGTATLERG